MLKSFRVQQHDTKCLLTKLRIAFLSLSLSLLIIELARAFPDSPEKRLNGFIVAKVQDLLQSYSLKLQLVSDETMSQFESRKGGGGGGLGGGKDKKGYGGMMAMAMMMKGTMMAMGKL